MNSSFSEIDNGTDSVNTRSTIMFDIFQLIGLMLLSGVLITAWVSSRISRVSTWFSLLFSWLVFSIGHLLIVGYQTGLGPEPSAILCLAQAMLIYASPALNSLTGLAFMLQIYLAMGFVPYVFKSGTLSPTLQKMLIIIPLLISFGIMIEVLMLGILSPEIVQPEPSGMYCHLTESTASKLSSIVSVSSLIMLIIVEVLLAVRLSRDWASCKQILIRNGMSLNVLSRVSIFAICSIISLGIGASSFVSSNPAGVAGCNLALSLMPGAVGVIFGSQRDILIVWMFWRKVDTNVSIC
ncbi:hypothetical protein B0H34DRAFT_802137 [Crassisporium funariophilum]|nr:hypothetical protein B0H34DRAFT_802137 [Crassisporium funariophilum]